jgi:serine/threonine-protein kinase
VKLADFGISKMLQDHQQQVESKTGIFNTVPPELAFLGYSTTQSDIYQLGLVLLTLLTGSNPIPETDRDMARQMIHNGVPRACAEQLIPSVGPLAEVISVMLRRRTEYRYRNATEVRDALQNVANTLRSTSPFGSFVTPNPSP